MHPATQWAAGVCLGGRRPWAQVDVGMHDGLPRILAAVHPHANPLPGKPSIDHILRHRQKTTSPRAAHNSVLECCAECVHNRLQLDEIDRYLDDFGCWGGRSAYRKRSEEGSTSLNSRRRSLTHSFALLWNLSSTASISADRL